MESPATSVNSTGSPPPSLGSTAQPPKTDEDSQLKDPSLKPKRPPTEATSLLPPEDVLVQAQGTEFGATMTMAVCTIGAGVLALPSAFGQAGAAVATGTVLFVGYLTVMSIRYLAQCIDLLDLHSYEDLGKEIHGRWVAELSRWVVIFYNLGADIGYIIVVGNLLEPFRPNLAAISTDLFVTSENFPKFAYWFCIMLPLSCVRSIEALKHSATAAIVAALYTASMVTYRYFVPAAHVGHFDSATMGAIKKHHSGGGHSHHHSSHGSSDGSDDPIIWVSLGTGCMLAMAIMMFAFDCQTMVFQIKANLKVPTVAAVTRVATGNVLISGSVYTAIGLFGYLSFRSAVSDDILSNYDPKKDFLATIAYVVYAVPVTMAYVMFLFPTRDSLFNAVLGTRLGEEIPGKYFYPTSIGLAIFTIVTALYVPSIVVICALLGGLFSSLICFILPASFVLKLHYNGQRVVDGWSVSQMWFMLIVGVVACILGTWASLIHALDIQAAKQAALAV